MWNDQPGDTPTPAPTPAEAIPDHEQNPEYEVHLGQVTTDGRRYVSFWLRGQRWSGWLDRD